MILIAGDIGGTTSRFQWMDTEQSDVISAPIYYQSSGYTSFTLLLKTLLHEHSILPIDVACFGLAGPINDTVVNVTNLPWQVSLDDVKTALSCEEVVFINDFHAISLGLDSVSDDALVCLCQGQQDGCAQGGNRLVIGAGTGLGIAPICQISQQFYPQPSEGGHIAFAPVNAHQLKLLEWAYRDCSHISYEYFLSGKGLERLYQFCCDNHGLCGNDLTAECIHSRANGGEQAAVEALRLFVMIYAQFIGDMALVWPASAGIYIAGGIGAKISSWLLEEDFKRSFLDKYEMRELVQRLPVYLVLDECVGLTGALLQARNTAEPELLIGNGVTSQ